MSKVVALLVVLVVAAVGMFVEPAYGTIDKECLNTDLGFHVITGRGVDMYNHCVNEFVDAEDGAISAGILSESDFDCVYELPEQPETDRDTILYSDCYMPILVGVGEYTGLGFGICTTETMSLLSPYFWPSQHAYLLMSCYATFNPTPGQLYSTSECDYSFYEVMYQTKPLLDYCQTLIDVEVVAAFYLDELFPEQCSGLTMDDAHNITSIGMECGVGFFVNTGKLLGYDVDDVCTTDVFYELDVSYDQTNTMLERCREQFPPIDDSVPVFSSLFDWLASLFG